MARHKKTKKHSRRRRSMRGGGYWYNPLTWGTDTPEQIAAKNAKLAADVTGTPAQQAAALGSSPGGTVSTGAPILGSTAATPLGPAFGGRRRSRRRKTRRRH